MEEKPLQLPAAGEVVGGVYRFERLIGRGGMGAVVSAVHVDTGERFAIKLLLPEVVDVPELVARFAREGRAAMRIDSPHVARVFEVGQLDEQRSFMVMEYLEGDDLRAALRMLGPLPVADAVRYVLEASHALGEAHAKGIVHRDLKPSNLFLHDRADGSTIVKVLDFGISKIQGEKSALTKTFDVIGTPHYMSPEQISNAKYVDERADLWSLGVILYELLTGARPFAAGNLAETVKAVLRAQPPPPSAHAEVPAELDGVVLRCLEGEPDARFDDVGELALALAPFTPGGAELAAAVVTARDKGNRPRQAAASANPAVRVRVPNLESVPSSSVTTALEQPAPRPRWRLVLLVVTLLLVAACVVLLGRSR